jgi:urease accessory protein
MITISARLHEKRPASLRLVLPFEQRCRSRLRVQLENGEEAGIFLPRGGVLRGGDLLLADDGRVIEVVSAEETVSTVRTDDARQLARVSYHLGNRHVPLQVGFGWVRYQHDHVLDEMVQTLGLTVIVEHAPFEPEAGAYDSNSHRHHVHTHEHTHGHPHRHSHDDSR